MATPKDRVDAPGGEDGTGPPGFGKGVNDYLNHHVTLADAKAGAILAGSLALGGGLLNHVPASDPYRLFAVSLALLAISAAVCAFVVFPRLPSGGRGLIFWEDIRSRTTPESYAAEVARLEPGAVESEYALQNWYVSQVLHDKHRFIRWAIRAFVVGVILAGLSFL